jgi:hypothetical protein
VPLIANHTDPERARRAFIRNEDRRGSSQRRSGDEGGPKNQQATLRSHNAIKTSTGLKMLQERMELMKR